ncbi:hypothetical protein CI1B_72930 [Bradyrhizobium ivorense]|uniref:Uncharacterized protein n=1 Tax=Bradyrhizobium ivorense TaxID=2511166 RepID=A0A508TVN0_9BRAD|nr:hypothetical protein [Bradyrhizobium ivorense]VIO78216.1 hypothetical protein CI1B_72930 [Bradyrhizobium ivorense]
MIDDVKLPKQVMDRIDARWISRQRRTDQRRSRMIDQRLEQLRAHRNNIQRYRRLLKTKLTDLERQFIERRLAKEHAAAQRTASDIPPLGVLPTPVSAHDSSGESL